jgi:translation initiation factor IF-1
MARREQTSQAGADALVLEGTVTDQGRGEFYNVACVVGEGTKNVLARRSGRLKGLHVSVVPGDRVRVEVSPYDPSRGRITARLT